PLEEKQLIRVPRREHAHVSSSRGDVESLRREPRAAGDVLRVAELRRRDLLSAEIGGGADAAVALHDERRAAARRAGDDADLAALRLRVHVERRTRSDVHEVDRPRYE